MCFLPLDVRPGRITFHYCGGQVPTQGAGFLPDRIAFGACLVELVPNFREVRLGTLGPGCFVVGAGDRVSSVALFDGGRVIPDDDDRARKSPAGVSRQGFHQDHDVVNVTRDGTESLAVLADR